METIDKILVGSLIALAFLLALATLSKELRSIAEAIRQVSQEICELTAEVEIAKDATNIKGCCPLIADFIFEDIKN